MKETCNYCGGELFTFGACIGCGARSMSKQDERPRYQRQNPFVYNGVIVWPIEDVLRDVYQFHFYVGDRLIQIIQITRELLSALSRVNDPNIDSFSFVWKMFEVACGHSDMETILDNSRRIPAVVAMTRVEYPKERLTWENVVEHYKMHPGTVIGLGDFANYL